MLSIEAMIYLMKEESRVQRQKNIVVEKLPFRMFDSGNWQLSQGVKSLLVEKILICETSTDWVCFEQDYFYMRPVFKVSCEFHF